MYTARAEGGSVEELGCGPPRKGGYLISVGSPERKSAEWSVCSKTSACSAAGAQDGNAPDCNGGMHSGLQQGAAGAPPPPAAPNQDEQLAGQRPHVLAQNALGYESETMLIQLLSHLPYVFCWLQEYVVSGGWSLQGHFPFPPEGLGEPVDTQLHLSDRSAPRRQPVWRPIA